MLLSNLRHYSDINQKTAAVLSYLLLLAAFVQTFLPVQLLRVLLSDGVPCDDILQTGQSLFPVGPKLPQQRGI